MSSRLIVASNRGPLSFRRDGEALVATRGTGGLVTAVTGALRDEEACWIAVALSDGDRARLRAGEPIRDGQVLVELEELDEQLLAGYYQEASNRGIWFAAHGGTARIPDQRAWDAYRAVNARIANRIADRAAPGATVLVHDYHLCLVPALLRAARPDLAISFFWHVPFPGPAQWWSLGDPVARELLEGICGADVVGVHALRWRDGLASCMQQAGLEARIEVLPLGIDVEALRAAAGSPEVDERLARLGRFDGQRLIVRSDRVEPAKAIRDGLEAFASLLEDRPDLRGTVTQLVRATSSREAAPEYREERVRIERDVAALHERFGTSDWSPVEFVVEDDLAASLAAFRRYDVLLVTSRADGMNLVAREGPLVNERNGVLVLSCGTGAADAYADDGALLHEPGDISSIRRALEEALDLDDAHRAQLARAAKERAPGVDPATWLEQQRGLAEATRDARLTPSR